MKSKTSRTSSSSSEDTGVANKRVQRSLWQRLVKPAAEIYEKSEQRQVSLISSLLFALVLSMISGVIYSVVFYRDPFSPNPVVGFILGGAVILMGIAYGLSRTRYYRSAVLLCLIILAIIPVLDVSLAYDKSPENLLLLLIWNSLTILLSSAMTSTRITTLFFVINILTLLLFPAFLPSVSFTTILVPLIFNTIISALILVFTKHRNLIEKDRSLELFQANETLKIELKERKRVEQKLAYTSLHDPLTDLPNRVLFLDHLNQAMERAKRNKDFQYAVFFLDLDRFKVVNDSQGHNIGDLLLIESGKRLTECVRSVDTVARLGGDEFVILLEDIKSPLDYIQVADRIQHKLAQPANFGNQKAFVSISTGIVLGDERYQRPEEILRYADIALYRAKNLGRGRYEIFDPAMIDSVNKRLEMETDLWKALKNHEFVVHYQPILEMQTHHIIGFEALVRWNHPNRGLIAPAEFIPTAEEIGLIVPMGYWVLEEACRQLSIWQKQYPSDPPLTINVNLSSRQCAQTDLVQKISEILQKNKLDPSRLKLELTESLVVEDSESTAIMLDQLRDMGIQIQIDDFGTGYSSLSYLQNLPIDALKIDRTFINQLGKNSSGLEIIKTILSLAHSLGMKVIAEGVETDDQLTQLKALDCEFVQGFLFAKPVNNLEASALLSKSLKKFKQ